MEQEVKQPTTYEEQVNKLKERGCIIEDDAFCIQKLKEVNYYRLTAYFIPFLEGEDHNKYILGTSFEKVYRIYEFDRKLRSILFSAIEDAEIYLRSAISYYHAHKYGPLGYLEPTNFIPRHNSKKFNHIVEEAIHHNENLPFVKHHIENYGRRLPIWAMVEILTFANISFFFSDMKNADQKAISSACFGVPHPKVLKSWIHCCSDLRNSCAHYGRLYNRPFSSVPAGLNLSPREERRLWGALIALRGLYPDTNKWNNTVCHALEALFDEYEDVIDLQLIAFSEDWKDKIRK